MKVRIKKTGEVYNIPEYKKIEVSQCDSLGNPLEFDFDEVEFIPTMFFPFEEKNTILLKPEKTIDWEERRYELVKGIISNIPSPTETDCDIVISIVDSLIKRLKDEKE